VSGSGGHYAAPRTGNSKPRGADAKGTTVPELDFKRIEFDKDEIDHARGVVAANSKDAEDCQDLLDKLGLLPEHEPPAGWYYDKAERYWEA
jgi:hypothetical protein